VPQRSAVSLLELAPLQTTVSTRGLHSPDPHLLQDMWPAINFAPWDQQLGTQGGWLVLTGTRTSVGPTRWSSASSQTASVTSESADL
jgi:hypothetical protein